MSSAYLGEVRTFGFNFAPRGTAMCNGQLLAITQYSALYALLGVTYGGNGSSTFALPDLRGRVPIHFGSDPGMSTYVLGQKAGAEQTTLITNNLPAHIHTFTGTMNASTGKATDQTPAAGSMLSRPNDQYGTDTPLIYVPTGTSGTTVGLAGVNGTTNATGSNQPFSILQPYLALNFCINLTGIFPSRN